MADDPNLVIPESKKIPKRIKGFRTSEKPLPYDSSKTYLQMGAAVQASDAARKGMRRIAILLDDVQVSRDNQTKALNKKLQEHLNKCEKLSNDWAEFELIIQRFDAIKQAELVPLISKAFAELKLAMGWYQKMIEAHRTEDQTEFLPIANDLSKVVTAIGKAREKKVAAALAMEERFSKTRHSYWNDKRAATNKKQGNATNPVEHQNQPYPVNSVTPQVALDPRQLLEQAAAQIRGKERSKIELKQQENAEKESGSE